MGQLKMVRKSAVSCRPLPHCDARNSMSGGSDLHTWTPKIICLTGFCHHRQPVIIQHSSKSAMWTSGDLQVSYTTDIVHGNVIDILLINTLYTYYIIPKESLFKRPVDSHSIVSLKPIIMGNS